MRQSHEQNAAALRSAPAAAQPPAEFVGSLSDPSNVQGADKHTAAALPLSYFSTLADMEAVIVRAVAIFENAAITLVMANTTAAEKKARAEDCESALRQLRPMLRTIRAFLEAHHE